MTIDLSWRRKAWQLAKLQDMKALFTRFGSVWGRSLRHHMGARARGSRLGGDKNIRSRSGAIRDVSDVTLGHAPRLEMPLRTFVKRDGSEQIGYSAGDYLTARLEVERTVRIGIPARMALMPASFRAPRPPAIGSAALLIGLRDLLEVLRVKRGGIATVG